MTGIGFPAILLDFSDYSDFSIFPIFSFFQLFFQPQPGNHNANLKPVTLVTLCMNFICAIGGWEFGDFQKKKKNVESRGKLEKINKNQIPSFQGGKSMP